jgi:hypothetical protein
MRIACGSLRIPVLCLSRVLVIPHRSMLDTPLRIVQANTNRGIQATESVLDYTVQKAVDIILV